MEFSDWYDLLDFDTSTSVISMNGDSTSSGAGTKTITATLTMDDDDQTTWSVEPFNSDITVIDCYPELDWLDTANLTSISVLDS